MGAMSLDNLDLAGLLVESGTVLGRGAVGNDQRAIGKLLEVIEPEFANFFHHRIGIALEIILILGEGVVIPEVL